MKISIAIINKIRTPVIRDDERLLSSEYKILVFNYHYIKGFRVYFEHVRLLFWLISNIRNYNIIYTRFIDKQAFIAVIFAKITGKKTIVVPAGDDVARIPELKFGVLLKKLNRIIVNIACNHATYVLPISKFTMQSLQKNLKLRNYDNIKVLPNEVDVEFFKPINVPLPRKNRIITIAGCDSIERYKLKGVDTFIELSKIFKSYEFIIIGISPKLTASILNIPENVKLISWQPSTILREYLLSAKYICSLSVFETFGRAFAEGMSCGCIPITFADIGPAELVEDSGTIIPSRDFKTIVEYFKQALKLPDYKSLIARNIIVNKYSFNIRKYHLKNLIDNMLNSSK